MQNYLQIEGDPTIWELSQPIDSSAVMLPGQPFRATIVAPLPGTLLLSCQAAASLVLFSPLDLPSGGGSIPYGGGAHLAMLTPSVYLPSVTGLTSNPPPGYALPPGTDLAALEDNITAAMSQRTFCTVEFSESALVLSGATLPFVVLFPAAPGA